ncbi:probable pectinesterase 56 [Henckelia pumila]|uniref:probable pectinesterase 56 n=1 Tax=Henckelia pumila TaxID=405737 RepID=UPI003C6E00E2
MKLRLLSHHHKHHMISPLTTTIGGDNFFRFFLSQLSPAASSYIDSNPTSRQLAENAERIPSMVGSKSPVYRKGKNSKIEFVESKDGKGEFRSISEALEASPSNSNDPVHINIESGEYYELINVDTHKTNIVLKGAGIDRTVIDSNVSLDGTRDITIAHTENNGVAVENWSNYSVFYNCKLKGVNGSLKAKGWNQFYRSCDVHGQNNLISGYTAVYFQKSRFFAESEKTVFSSQSSMFFASNIYFTFDRCSFYAVGGGQRMKNSSTTSYLGKLLGMYSKIVVIQSYLDESIHYILVNNTFPNTAHVLISYNYDPGAAISHVEEIGDINVAFKFSLRVFLDKKKWKLPDIDYDLNFST